MAITLSKAIAAIADIRTIAALEPILVHTTTTASREMYVITAIKSIQTIMTITVTTNAAITAIMAFTAKWQLQPIYS